jgi:hypothetical protein
MRSDAAGNAIENAGEASRHAGESVDNATPTKPHPLREEVRAKRGTVLHIAVRPVLPWK